MIIHNIDTQCSRMSHLEAMKSVVIVSWPTAIIQIIDKSHESGDPQILSE